MLAPLLDSGIQSPWGTSNLWGTSQKSAKSREFQYLFILSFFRTLMLAMAV